MVEYEGALLTWEDAACRRSQSQLKEGILRVQATNSRVGFEVTTDGVGMVGHAGAALLRELADRLGLTGALAWRVPRPVGAVAIRMRRCCGTWR